MQQLHLTIQWFVCNNQSLHINHAQCTYMPSLACCFVRSPANQLCRPSNRSTQQALSSTFALVRGIHSGTEPLPCKHCIHQSRRSRRGALIAQSAEMASQQAVIDGAPRVVICGGGVIGCAIAYFLSLRGVAATIVERAEIACAASGASIAFCHLHHTCCGLTRSCKIEVCQCWLRVRSLKAASGCGREGRRIPGARLERWPRDGPAVSAQLRAPCSAVRGAGTGDGLQAGADAVRCSQRRCAQLSCFRPVDMQITRRSAALLRTMRVAWNAAAQMR